ncbi:MAG TPA: hypothetical protein VFZ61_06365 [Polyangiales bacterium]
MAATQPTRQAPPAAETRTSGAVETDKASADGGQASRGASKAKTFAAEGCTPLANTEAKIVSGDASASDSADSGRALVFDVAGIAVEFPACTPAADMRVITVSWETKERPNATRIHPQFTRHAATLRVDQMISAAEGANLLVRLQSKRELMKPGEKLMLAVESSGECDAAHKRDKLEDGECSHWQLFDTSFDASRNEMVARIPATGGYRLQFGWVPSK